MTREFTFTLGNHLLKYNLWTDLILPQITDRTFSNTSYVPNVVSDLQIYDSLQPAANSGANISVMNNAGTFEAANLISDGKFQKTSVFNSIDLTRFSVQGSADNVQIDVSISAN